MRAITITFKHSLGILALLVASAFFSNNLNAATISSSTGGTWSNGSIWVGGVKPGTSDDAYINDGHNITIQADESIQGLRVYASSFTVLTINSGVTLTVTGDVHIQSTGGSFFSQIANNGTLVIEGDLYFDGPSATQAVLNMGSMSNLILEGELILNSAGRLYSNSSSFYTTTFQGSTWQNMSFDGSNIVYNHVVINNSNGVYLDGNMTASNVIGRIDIYDGFLNDGGNSITGKTDSTLNLSAGTALTLTGTNGMPAGFSMVIDAGSTINYNGSSQTITAPNNGQNYGNLGINCSGTATLGANVTINGNLSLTGGTLDASVSNYDMDVKGNWLNSGGTFTARSGGVTFSGAANQVVSSNGSDFYDVTINNSDVTGITLGDDLTASNSITLTDGVISTGGFNVICTNTSASSVSGYSSASFINGNLRRYIATNTSTYGFPVGIGTGSSSYYLAEVLNNNLSGTSYLTASFGALTNHDNNDMGASDAYMTYQSVAPDGVWIITPNSQPGGGTYGVQLYITNFSSQLTDNEFGPLKRSEASTTAADWSDAGGTMSGVNGAGRLTSDGYAMRSGFNSFSEFGIGRASVAGNPLPVELVSFSAEPTEDKTVALNWVTAVEIQNDHFTIERSPNGVDFSEVTRVEGKGNSSETSYYNALDLSPNNGTNYYRLKQTDFNGEFTYSDIVSVNFGEVTVEPTVSVYPNPTNGNEAVTVNISNASAELTEIKMIEISTGRLIHQETITGNNNQIPLPTNLSAGMYILQATHAGRTTNTKLLVK